MNFRYWIVLISLAGYIIIWTLLFVFPIWRKKNPIIITHEDSEIILGAHRGGSLERVENTLPAFAHSKELGIHLIELDVQLTRDKKVVVHHDKDLHRLTGDDRSVAELDYEDLPVWMQWVPTHFPGEYYEQKEGIDDGKIPLLKDVFELCPTIPINIDLKGGSEELAFEVYKLIVEYGREDITYFGDMDEGRNKKAKEMGRDAGIRTFASIKYTFLTVVFYFLGILQFIPFRHYSIWYPFFSREKLTQFVQMLGNKWYHRCFVCLYSWLTFCMKPMFWHLRRKGVLVMFWTVNSEQEYLRAITYPIDGIISDRPEEIKRVSDSRQHHSSGGSGEQMMNSHHYD